jgi:iron complex outermembrane receptor protein
VQSATTGRATQLHRGSVRIGWLLLLVFLLLLLISVPVRSEESAGNSAAGAPEVQIEEIVVTGTRIKRRDFQTASPLATISRQDIEFTGQPTLEETLNRMPQVMPHIGRTSNNPSLGPNPGIGGAEVDLRGMGPNRTLVLLNGRRVAPSSTDNRVDLNNIPQILVDRIEVISGGTSAVYGSDAIAGVVNFITREDYSGLGVEASLSMSEQGDAEVYDLGLAYGHNFSDGRGNITLYGTLLERKSLLGTEREITSAVYWDDWNTGEIVEGGSTALPEGLILFPFADLGNGPAQVMFEPDGTPRELVWPDGAFNYAPHTYLQVPLDRYSAGLMGNYALSSRFEAYVEAAYVRNEPTFYLPSVPAFVPAEINIDNPFLTPEAQQIFADNYACAPNLACVFLSKRPTELGPRIAAHERDYSRIVAGIRGELWDGWNFDGWVTYTDSSTEEWLRNDASRSRLLQGLLVDPVTNECFDPTGGCAPLNIFGEGNLSPEGVEFLRVEPFANRTDRTNTLASVFVTGSPTDTWAGPLDTAIGLEWRRDELSFHAGDGLFSGDTLGYITQSPIDGASEVGEIYAEAVIPLVADQPLAKQLVLELGGRYSDYSHAGSGTTYKAGGEWQPIDGLRFRAMRQRTQRAPNTGELFEEQRINFGIGAFVLLDPSEDPCSASADPVGNGNAEKCIIQGLPPDQVGVFEATPFYPTTFYTGGNPELRPETGETWTVGVVIAPPGFPNWTASIDYYAIEITDTIGSIDATLICFDPANTDHIFCDEIARDATGNVYEVWELTSNRGVLETNGIDTQIQYAAELPGSLALAEDSADIRINVFWTHMFENKEQENPATEILDCAGYFGWPCDTDARVNVYAKDRVTSNLHYTSGPFEAHLIWRWIAGTDNAGPLRSAIVGFPDPNLAIPSVDDEHYLDLGLSYAFRDNLTVRFGVNNLLDNDPPFMADAVWDINTAMSLYDVFGRSYYLTLSAQL